MCREHAAACRVVVVGVGQAASRHYLRMLAKAGGGLAEFVPEKQSSSELAGRMKRLLERAGSCLLYTSDAADDM
eukprot:5147871-Prymnesium_polylepis.1